MDILTLIILILATWRLSSLFTGEDGPFMILAWLREKTKLFECLWCLSVSMGIGISLLFWHTPGLTFWLCLPFALSAGAIMFDRWNQ